MTELITESKQRKAGNGVFLHTPVTLYTLVGYRERREMLELSVRKTQQGKRRRDILGLALA